MLLNRHFLVLPILLVVFLTKYLDGSILYTKIFREKISVKDIVMLLVLRVRNITLKLEVRAKIQVSELKVKRRVYPMAKIMQLVMFKV